MAEQRTYHALRAHIDQMIAEGWRISGDSPVLLRRGDRVCSVCEGMIVEEVACG